MKRVTILSHQGKPVLYIDFRNITIFPKNVLQELMSQVKDYLIKQPPNSVLALTNLTNLYYDQAIIALFTEYLIHNKSRIRASAVVGFPPDLHDVLSDIQKASEREIYLCNSENEALDWLVGQ